MAILVVIGVLHTSCAGMPSSLGGTSDRDGDGIPDGNDRCPDAPEDFDGFEDEDGCPDFDNDRDGIPDVVDACMNNPGPPSALASEHGCPKR
jgi:hypothetical protein